jgi:hypothetical protein
MPGEGFSDPLVQMGFDPEFLQRLNDSYGEINPDGLEGMHLDEDVGHKGVGGQGWPNSDILGQPTPQPLMGEVPTSDPVGTFNSKEGHTPASDASKPDLSGFLNQQGHF